MITFKKHKPFHRLSQYDPSKTLNATQLRKRKEGICVVSRCRRKRNGRSLICHTHKWRRNKLINPIGALYDRLRSSANHPTRGANRRIEFTITIDDLTEVIKDSGYLELCGQGKYDLTIDRKIGSLGYIKGNLQVIPKGINSAKYHAGDGVDEDDPF